MHRGLGLLLRYGVVLLFPQRGLVDGHLGQHAHVPHAELGELLAELQMRARHEIGNLCREEDGRGATHRGGPLAEEEDVGRGRGRLSPFVAERMAWSGGDSLDVKTTPGTSSVRGTAPPM